MLFWVKAIPSLIQTLNLDPWNLNLAPQTDEDFYNRYDDFSKSKFYGLSDGTQMPGWKNWMMRIYPKGVARALAAR